MGDDPLFEPTILFQLKLVAKIALTTSLICAAVLMLVILFVSGGQSGQSYLKEIQSLVHTKSVLAPALFMAGLVLVSIIGMLIWMISVYSSAHISGPLFRFARNLELEIAERGVPLVKIRDGDYLHSDAMLLEETVAKINQHYDELLRQVGTLNKQLESNNLAEIKKTVASLKTVEQRVKLRETQQNASVLESP